MRFEEKLRKLQAEEVWQEYCGFLDLDLASYMQIQRRLMDEQIAMWSKSGLGKQILRGKRPKNLEEFRQAVPLTTYADYADVLLMKRADMLPDEPVIWIETTWEGGHNPVKTAPYTRSMLDTYRDNVLACLLLASSTERGKFSVRPKDRILYALAPLPYATGLFPLALNEGIEMEFLPPVKEAEKMSFSERNKRGFKLGMQRGIEYFFGLGSVAYFVSLSLSSLGQKSGGSGGGTMGISPVMIARYLRAKQRCKKEGRELKPKDLFKLKGFMCAGTDNRCYKDDLEDLWGVRPLELFAGTEPSIIGAECWSRQGMYFFPDACFYEFIPEYEMERGRDDPDYQPRTCLMDEVIPGEKYELAVSVLKGGAFVRYRVGDVYRCLGLTNPEDQTRIPRFEYVDRVPDVIDIAGFTRITEQSISSVTALSGLRIKDWVATKEYSSQNRPYLHLYVEMEEEAIATQAVSREVLREHLSVYFKYMDQDYKDLKRILGIEPLEVTLLKCGSFRQFARQNGRAIRRINPSAYDIRALLQVQELSFELYRDRGV